MSNVACHCLQGWICERHRERPWTHDKCLGMALRCPNPACPWWQGDRPFAMRHKLNYLRSVSVHEVGHAVVAGIVGFGFDLVAVDSTVTPARARIVFDSAEGRFYSELVGAGWADAAKGSDRIKRHLRVALAGYQAENLAAAAEGVLDGTIDGGDEDRAKARSLARVLHGDSYWVIEGGKDSHPGTDDLSVDSMKALREATSEVAALVATNFGVVDQLARELQRSGAVSADRVRTLVANAHSSEYRP